MKYLKDISWIEVYEAWRNSEKKNNVWRAFYKNRGHKTWEEFRGGTIKDFDLPKLNWKLYEVRAEEVPDFNCGPYSHWEDLAKKIGEKKFRVLMNADFFKDHAKLESIKKDFPKEDILIGIEKGEEVYLLEGHHRCVAIAQMLRQGRGGPVKIKMALAKVT